MTISASEYTKPLYPVLRAAYAQLGYQVTFLEEPPERALRDANSGVCDANVGRIRGILDAYPNLVYTNEALTEVEVQVWAKRGSKITVSKPEDLRPFTVGAALGSKAPEAVAASVGMTLERATTVDEIAKMLERDRIDLALVTNISATPFLASVAVLVQKTLATQKAFHILNRK
jgi:ABC-type amino acid transport substrate-binding protein